MAEHGSARDIGSGIIDDVVLPFQTVQSGVTGRLVRLGSVVDTVLNRHDYPQPVGEALGQALALGALLGTALKFDGRLIIQTKSDGPLGFLVVNYETPDSGTHGQVRGYASFDAERLAAGMAGSAPGQQAALLGHGHLAMTIDPGGDMDRYQGIVALEGTSLTGAALNYFRQSEQLPTYLRLAVARHFVAGANGAPGSWAWRAGGLMIQYLSRTGGKERPEAQSDEDEVTARGRAERGLEPGAAAGGHGRGPRTARPDTGARPPALPVVSRGGRRGFAGEAYRGVLPMLARARRGIPEELRRR